MKPTYEELEAKVLDMAVQLANAESKCRELVAESVGLKRVPASDSETMLLALDAFATHGCARPDVGLQQAINVVMQRRETPATDAFMAEVRAQGVEMFAMCIAHRVNYSEVDKSIELDALSFAEGLRNPAPELSPEELTELAAQLLNGAAL